VAALPTTPVRFEWGLFRHADLWVTLQSVTPGRYGCGDGEVGEQHVRNLVVVGLTSAVIIWGAAPATACGGFIPPVSGPVARPFAPLGAYAGHWGIDLSAAPGTPVRAVGAGVVRFSGIVAGNRTVTVDHGGEVWTSYSFLTEIAVTAGARVLRGAVLGASGGHGDIDGVHLSLRVGRRYRNPASLFDRCRPPHAGLRLRSVFALSPYARSGAGTPRRHLRPTPSRPPGGR